MRSCFVLQKTARVEKIFMIYERNFFLTGIFLQVYRLGVNVSFMFFAYRKSKNSLKFQCIQGDKDKNLTISCQVGTMFVNIIYAKDMKAIKCWNCQSFVK